MVDFLKIDLDQRNQPAIVRLKDNASFNGDTTLTQARFDITGTVIARLRTDKKAKEFFLTPDEMDTLCDAWMDYRGALIQHAREIEERKEQVIAEAKALTKSVQFDLEGLNIEVRYEDDYWGWIVENHDNVIHFHNEHLSAEQLPERVQAALNYLKSEVEKAEDGGWGTNDYYRSRVASYRRAFPLVTKQGELSPDAINAIQDLTAAIREANENYVDPETIITEARQHLTILSLTDWVIAREPQTSNYNFIYGHGQIALHDKPAAEILAFIRAYAPFSPSDLQAMSMDQAEHKEPSEHELDIAIEQALLETSSLPVSDELEHEYYP